MPETVDLGRIPNESSIALYFKGFTNQQMRGDVERGRAEEGGERARDREKLRH